MKPKSDRFITARAERKYIIAQLAVKKAKGLPLSKSEQSLLASWRA